MPKRRSFEIAIDEGKKLHFLNREFKKGLQDKAISNIISGGVCTDIESIKVQGVKFNVCLIFPENSNTKSFLNFLANRPKFFVARKKDSICLDTKHNVIWMLDKDIQDVVVSILKNTKN
jgi:hypothetical protein